jgi:hypothetical protein
MGKRWYRDLRQKPSAMRYGSTSIRPDGIKHVTRRHQAWSTIASSMHQDRIAHAKRRHQTSDMITRSRRPRQHRTQSRAADVLALDTKNGRDRMSLRPRRDLRSDSGQRCKRKHQARDMRAASMCRESIKHMTQQHQACDTTASSMYHDMTKHAGTISPHPTTRRRRTNIGHR